MVGASIKRENGSIRIVDAENWLVYVHKKQEGKVMQYYILPDFNYNAYREGFLNASDLQKMNEFFTDSRALFGQHNKDIKERKVSENSTITALYKKYLSSYYAVELSPEKLSLLDDPTAKNYVHLTVDTDGKRHLLSGVCDNLEQAKGHARFVKDCKLDAEPRIVKVTPGSVVEIVE